MGSSLAVLGEQGLGLFKGSASPGGILAVDRLTNKSENLSVCCSMHTYTHWYTHKQCKSILSIILDGV